ncbi:MAG: hypothetical protein JW388_0539 [Nitrospira sp.]|nr:hypothetical protein [Nitrospira sp.]
MAWYRLAYRPIILQDLAGLEPTLAQRLLDKTKWLASNVDNLRHEPLAPDLAGLFKYAVDDWRIFYSLDRDEHLVDIHHISTRTALNS